MRQLEARCNTYELSRSEMYHGKGTSSPKSQVVTTNSQDDGEEDRQTTRIAPLLTLVDDGY